MIIRLVKETFYRLIYHSGLWIIFRKLNRHKIGILMYHGIAENDEHLWTQVHLQNFREQIGYVGDKFNVITLDEAVRRLKSGILPPDYPLVITFDDGFKSNETLAYEILKARRMPATIFLTTSFVNGNSRYNGLIRTDYIIGLFRNTGATRLDLSDQGLGIHVFKSLQERMQSAYRVSGAIKRMNHREVNRIIDIIGERLGKEISQSDMHIFRGMDWNDVRNLHSDGLITFGAHTVNHDILSMLPKEMMEEEIRRSRVEIESQLGRPPDFFAYPNGTELDFNQVVKETAAKYYDCALTTVQGLNAPGVDLFALKRIAIGNDTKLWKLKLELSGTIDFIRSIKVRIFGRNVNADSYGQ